MMEPMLKQVTEWTAWTLNPEAMQAQDVWYCDKEHQVLKKLLPDQWRTASMVLVSSCIYHVLEVWCTCMLNLPTCPLFFSRDKQEGASPLHTQVQRLRNEDNSWQMNSTLAWSFPFFSLCCLSEPLSQSTEGTPTPAQGSSASSDEQYELEPSRLTMTNDKNISKLPLMMLM